METLPRWTTEAARVARFLAGNPNGVTTLDRADYRSLVLCTDGMMMAWGRLYKIEGAALGASVYQVSLKLVNS